MGYFLAMNTDTPIQKAELERFFAWIVLGDVANIRRTISSKPGFIHSRLRGYTPLHIAVQHRQGLVVRLLLQKGAEVGALVEGSGTSVSEMAKWHNMSSFLTDFSVHP